jgi:S-adenosylmethionine uptake transporter
MVLTDNMRGAAFMTGSMVAFTVNDAFMKILFENMPIFQGLFLRSVLVVVLLAIFVSRMGTLRWDFGAGDRKLIALRTASEIGGVYFFMTALVHMPIANVAAILQALPLTVSLAASIFLGEAIGWRRMVAILVGFAGVLLIIRPSGEDFSIYSIYALMAVVCVTARDLFARRLSPDVPSTSVALLTAIGIMVFFGAGSAFSTWTPVTLSALGLMAGASLFVIGGYIFSVSAMRVGEIAAVTPFRYSSLLTALILGLAVFGEWPDALTLLGSAIVVATGLFTLYREQTNARASHRGIRPR